MSCRAMGFGLEQAVLRLVIDAEGDTKPMVGRFVPTDRNSPAALLFSSNGFAQSGATEWRLERRQQGPGLPEWLAVEARQ
jgi:predicted enzyme involved in methoxymalonyl-ACP biosynthesis